MHASSAKGLELLSSMRKKRVRANSTCVNAAVHGFALLGDWKMALEILGAMEKAFQVVPDAVGVSVFFILESSSNARILQPFQTAL